MVASVKRGIQVGRWQNPFQMSSRSASVSAVGPGQCDWTAEVQESQVRSRRSGLPKVEQSLAKHLGRCALHDQALDFGLGGRLSVLRKNVQQLIQGSDAGKLKGAADQAMQR